MDIEILQDDRLRAWCERLQIPQGAIEALAQVAQEIRTNDELAAIFNAFYEESVIGENWHWEMDGIPMNPRVKEILGERDSLFYLLGYLSALPKAERYYRRLGIGLDVFHATMRDITLWLNHEYDLTGRWMFRQFGWVRLHIACRLYRLGRLQFVLSEFGGKVTAFRHRVTGQILLLGSPETQLRPDGYAEGAGGKPSGEDTWHAVFEATPAGWRGNRITPQGTTRHEAIFLLRSDWERVLQHGDTVLEVHIPRGESMTPEACKASFEWAYRFFPEFWPDRPFRGAACHTWFFTPQLQQILPPDSNIVRFQREFYLYPHAGGPQFLWAYVFGERYPDPATAPRDTALRSAVLDWLAAGNELFDMPGVMLHSPDNWGTQPYYTNTQAIPNTPETTEVVPPISPIFTEEADEDEDEDDLLDDEDYPGETK